MYSNLESGLQKLPAGDDVGHLSLIQPVGNGGTSQCGVNGYHCNPQGHRKGTLEYNRLKLNGPTGKFAFHIVVQQNIYMHTQRTYRTHIQMYSSATMKREAKVDLMWCARGRMGCLSKLR